MITKRIIPSIYVRDGALARGSSFREATAPSPVALAKKYSDGGADELLFYQLNASSANRETFFEMLREAAKTVFIPLTVGGGVSEVSDFERALACGADKVSVNTGAIRNPSLIGEAAKRYGDQCVVLSVDVRRVNGAFHVFSDEGSTDTGLEAVEWIHRCAGEGAGEVVVNSKDAAQKKNGFDIELLRAVCAMVHIPVIASGGASRVEHFTELFQAIPTIDAGLASAAFHYDEIDVGNLKATLRQNGVHIRF